VTVPFALSVLALVIIAGACLSRRVQSGYIDYLTPLLAMYALHSVTRGATLFYHPDRLHLNAQIAAASERAIAEALMLTAVAICPLVVSYLIGLRLIPSRETPISALIPVSLGLAAGLIAVGVLCRTLLRLSSAEEIALPDWAATPIETVGWAALAGVFTAGFRCGRSRRGDHRTRAAWATAAGTIVVLLVDARMSVSREATLQPILAALLGVMMGAGLSVVRIAIITGLVGLPLFVWIGAMKIYAGLGLADAAPGYVEALPVVRERSEFGWSQWAINVTQDRFHGLDSLIVTRSLVPEDRPYESGSLWTKVLVSAFVPRALYPEKQVGWGSRFATEFWGVAPESEGQAAAVGISHLGTFYIYGGTLSCLTGMAILGFGLGALAAYLRGRRNVFGPTVFVLTALTIWQLDRDLEVVLGGVLKQLAIFAILLLFRPLVTVAAPPRSRKAALVCSPESLRPPLRSL
jgi:hypothetical protein